MLQNARQKDSHLKSHQINSFCCLKVELTTLQQRQTYSDQTKHLDQTPLIHTGDLLRLLSS